MKGQSKWLVALLVAALRPALLALLGGATAGAAAAAALAAVLLHAPPELARQFVSFCSRLLQLLPPL